MQDKQDRSAKRQEELARETGASLINVPNKPPPPQTGLLGAITAHERERKREGGVGAALTEREREKRLAEDRQRKLDEFQRQQLEMAQSGMFGGQVPMGMNPMMGNPMMNPMMPMNPMMTGTGPMMQPTNPMMTGGFMGYPSMMPGYGGQPYMFAAQQAAQAAYQQAMMAFSAGGDGMHGPSPMAPMMTGGGMSFDPRMSMMGMPMMNPGMPMGGGMAGGMGGGMGMMGGMGGMGMQMTGGSAFDARFSPTGMDDLRPPGALGGQNRSGNHSSRNSSAGQASPAGPRPVDAPRDSPKH
jgi:CCR4-NOT transcriptional complex subunit CAF120